MNDGGHKPPLAYLGPYFDLVTPEDAIQAILDTKVRPARDWQYGSCVSFALALHDLLDTGEYWMLGPSHVVLKVGTAYYDSLGKWTKDGLIKKFTPNWNIDVPKEEQEDIPFYKCGTIEKVAEDLGVKMSEVLNVKDSIFESEV